VKNADFQVAVWRLVLAAAAFGAWEGIVALGWLNPFWASSPVRIAVALVDIVREPLFATHVSTTLVELVAGFLIGAALGIAIGFVLAEWPVAERILAPYLAALNSLPRVALAPLFILWLGIGMWSKIVMAATLVVFIVIGNTLAAARSVDADMLDLARSMRAGAFRTFRRIRLPNALPSIFGGLKVSITLAVVGAVVGEFVGSNSGIGYVLQIANGNFDLPLMFAALFVLSMMGVLLFTALEVIERLMIPWHSSRRGDLAGTI